MIYKSRSEDAAAIACRIKDWILFGIETRSHFGSIPRWLEKYQGKSFTDRCRRIFKRITRSGFYFAEEYARTLTSILKKYAGRFSRFGDYGFGAYNGHCFLPGEFKEKDLVMIMVSEFKKAIEKEKDMDTTGKLRMILAQALIDARDGKLSGDALRGVIGAANQINSSFAVEIKMRKQLQSEGVALGKIGSTRLSEDDQ